MFKNYVAWLSETFTLQLKYQLFVNKNTFIDAMISENQAGFSHDGGGVLLKIIIFLITSKLQQQYLIVKCHDKNTR